MTIDDFVKDVFSRQDSPCWWNKYDGTTKDGDVGWMMDGILLFVEELKQRTNLNLDHIEVKL